MLILHYTPLYYKVGNLYECYEFLALCDYAGIDRLFRMTGRLLVFWCASPIDVDIKQASRFFYALLADCHGGGMGADELEFHHATNVLCRVTYNSRRIYVQRKSENGVQRDDWDC